MLFAKITYLFRIGIAAIEMDNADGFGTSGNRCLNEVIINLQSIQLRLHQHGLQTVLRDGENGSDVGVGRNNHLVARLHHAQLDVGTENPNQRVQAVGATYAVLGTDKASIVGFEAFVLLALEIPATVHHAGDSCIDFVTMQRGDFF